MCTCAVWVDWCLYVILKVRVFTAFPRSGSHRPTTGKKLPENRRMEYAVLSMPETCHCCTHACSVSRRDVIKLQSRVPGVEIPACGICVSRGEASFAPAGNGMNREASAAQRGLIWWECAVYLNGSADPARRYWKVNVWQSEGCCTHRLPLGAAADLIQI